MHKENLHHFIVSYYFILELNIFNSIIDKISFYATLVVKEGDT